MEAQLQQIKTGRETLAEQLKPIDAVKSKHTEVDLYCKSGQEVSF